MFFFFQILLNIISFLNLKEIKIVRQVSQQFNQLSIIHMKHNSRLNITKKNVNNLGNSSFSEPRHILITAMNLIHNNSILQDSFYKQTLKNAESLILSECLIDDSVMYRLLENSSKLKSLQLYYTKYLPSMMAHNQIDSATTMDYHDEEMTSCSTIEDLRMLYFCSTDIFLNKSLFINFLRKIEKSLKRFDIEFMQAQINEWNWFNLFNFNLEHLSVRIHNNDSKILTKFLNKITGRAENERMDRLKIMEISLHQTVLDDGVDLIDFRKLNNL